MKTPGPVERLLDSDATPFERQLLESARAERLPPELSARMQQALGLGVARGPALPVAETSSFAGSKGAMWLVAAALMAGGGLSLWPWAPEVTSTEAARQELASPAEQIDDGASESRAALAQKAEATSALREEIELVDSIRAALQGKQPERARALLARHAERFPDGALSVEAEALRKRADEPPRDQRPASGENPVETASGQ